MDKWEDTVMAEYKPNEGEDKAPILLALEDQAKTTWDIAFKVGKEEGKQEGIEEAIKVYEPYIKALEDENSSLIGLAYVHGWRSSQVKFGEKCRKEIKDLKTKYLGKPSSKRGGNE